ncbi:MAG: carbohydrate-binding protein [Tyzzerella sp.]|nr:carbohydrate-binding protein [Tyzzerella sp.]
MSTLTLRVVDKTGETICQATGERFVDLVCKREYEEGDQILLESSEKNLHINVQLDDALGKAQMFLKEDLIFDIPFNEKRFNRSPKIFSGNLHYLYAEEVLESDIHVYRNLALNQNDQHKEIACYPHASANVETRGESVFAAQNAIDGVRANLWHGSWPWTSWGINRQADAEIKIDFGRTVWTDKIVLYTRADFPHDSWWTQVTLHFSDGTSINWKLEKTNLAQVLEIEPKEISWIKMNQLIKAEDESPFPALTQIEVYGADKQ